MMGMLPLQRDVIDAFDSSSINSLKPRCLFITVELFMCLMSDCASHSER